ncbi:DUF4331 domain-containing protein [Hymenobacter sp. IS2118]|uniref:DUF4331 domain-containing protein n=1 Tax=Hymenobacter sp. IS2118 TaxID=1505605 RepID=UPI0009DE0943|nr:DUF4331 domain-containing protein [Hymenobacter sp. IS2118]
MKNLLSKPLQWVYGACAVTTLSVWSATRHTPLEASSHREAPLIADDPLADVTDVYAFRAPDAPERVVLIADYIPFQLPQGGPNYATFGENIRYEIHVKNNSATPGDDVTYRFTFKRVNEDPSTFFNIRLGAQNLKTTYTCEKSLGGGAFTTIVTNGVVPPYNIGPRSINGGAGLNQGAPYATLRQNAVTNASGGGGEQIFCGSSDDPFFVDLGAVFDLAGVRINQGARDGLAKYNVHSIALSIPIETVQKNNRPVSEATSILDPNYVIGVWASASRPTIRTLSATGGPTTDNDTYVQVSRLGMPLTNEAVTPIGGKDLWNRRTPYNEEAVADDYLSNPELALYMDDRQFGGAVPALSALRVQTRSLAGFPGLPAGGFDFGNTRPGLFPLKGSSAVAGTALDDAAFGNYLLVAGKPRSVDIKPIFHTGVPNLRPYQLATGKGGNPLAYGKPFVNNFLPLAAPGRTNPGGDMLRLNMAVPVTPRNSPDFSNQGLIAAAVLGLTDPRFNTNVPDPSTADPNDFLPQNIPNMDGFPNGRRLEDEVVKIELQAVSGVALAAIGLWYDDYTPTSPSPVTPRLKRVLNFSTGVESNDAPFATGFPYLATPWEGFATRR